MSVTLETPDDEFPTFLRCRTRDVGFGGMYLLTGPANFHVDQRLDIEFRARPEAPTTHRIPASVVRVTEDGLGVQFRALRTADVRALQEILLRPAADRRGARAVPDKLSTRALRR